MSWQATIHLKLVIIASCTHVQPAGCPEPSGSLCWHRMQPTPHVLSKPCSSSSGWPTRIRLAAASACVTPPSPPRWAGCATHRVLASHTRMLLSLEPLQKRRLGHALWAGSHACRGRAQRQLGPLGEHQVQPATHRLGCRRLGGCGTETQRLFTSTNTWLPLWAPSARFL